MSYIQEAIREWVWIVGAERLDQQWLLSDYDSWERNPHYRGPDQGHPEDYYDPDGQPDEAQEWHDYDPDC